jgi:hypothetical protein
MECQGHGLINYMDNKAKCYRLKKITWKGTSWQVFIRAYRLEIQSYWYFRPTRVNCCPSLLLTGSNPHPPPASLCE